MSEAVAFRRIDAHSYDSGSAFGPKHVSNWPCFVTQYRGNTATQCFTLLYDS